MSKVRWSIAATLCGTVLACAALAQKPAKPPVPGLRLAFGDSILELKAGSFTASPAGPLGGPMITANEKIVLALESKPLTGARQLKALVRLRTDLAPTVSASFSVAKTDAKDPGLRMTLSTTRNGDHVSCTVQQQGKPLHDLKALAKDLDWTPEWHNGFSYYPRAYPFKDIRPGWPEDFRLHIEHDMAALPDVPDKWLAVRIDVQPGEVCFWLEDRLVARKTGTDIPVDGFTRIELSPGVQLAGYEVSSWKPVKGYVPIALQGYANSRTFLGNTVKPESLPAGDPLTIDGVPFVVPSVNAEGNDHIDVGKSLYRQGMIESYSDLLSYGPRWIGSTRRDPARIQLRIPNRQYDSLYLLAGADGRPNSIPLVTAMFFRPGAGFAESFEAEVPLATAQINAPRPVPVTLANGKQVQLWVVKVPLDPGRLSAFGDMDIVEVELTTKVHLYRSYPDPILYSWHQAGLPSSVHIYGATLGETPVGFDLAPDKFGHVWTAPEVPSYTATLTNHTQLEQKGRLVVQADSYDRENFLKELKPINLAKGERKPIKFSLPAKRNGYYDLSVTLEINGKTWTEKRSFVRLAPDTRAPRWTEGKGALFGYWSYHGGHHTPKADRHIELMTAAGARASIGVPNREHPLVKKHWGRTSAGAWEVAPQPWAAEEPYDPKKYADYQKTVVEAFRKAREKTPPEYRPDHVYFFPEPHVSQRLTEGNYPEYWNGAPLQYTEDEKKRLRMFMVTAKCAAEAVRKEWPELKVLIPWGDALFAVPLLRAGFPKNLIDGSGIDTPGFERLPEMQLHQISVHRLYELRKEYEKAGITHPRLQYTEGIFVPTEPGAVSWREQMDIYNRWVVLSMAYGVDRFYSGWFAFDCGNYYGSEHYGGCGIQRRIPYCDPKPAYAAYATMTDRLDQANFDGWLKTGSLTTYCLCFKGPKGNVYTLWTLRGKRPATLTLAADGDVHVTDAMNNTRTLKSQNKQVTIGTDPSVVYVTGAEVVSVAVGDPDHSDTQPSKDAKLVADLGDGSWSFRPERNKVYENGTFAMVRYPGQFQGEVATDPTHGKVFRSTLGKQEKVHELMPWYGVLTPKKTIVLPGAPSTIGLWVKGASDWGRVVYVLRDAKGEKWTSIGTQDQYNCDDVHSWSAFNFDGWRYVRFELPGNTGYDSFRKHGTTWWRSDGGDGIVDLPLTLESIIIEQRSHVLYVNDVQPAASDTVLLGKLHVEYSTPADATPAAVVASKLRMPLPKGAANLPNPIAESQKAGVGEPTTIIKLEPPLEHNDGSMVHVHFQEVSGAKEYQVWVSAHADGRGAINMAPKGAKSGVLLRNLRPALPFYFWVTYMNAQGEPSKPSKPATATLVDTFKEK
jgi:hypothetical protein